MAQVTATTSRTLPASPDSVTAALSDYSGTRPKILTEHFSNYRVEEGGTGAGTRAGWRLQATKKRVREQLVAVSTPGEGTIVEDDANSSMVTTWTVGAAAGGGSTVTVTSTWNGATGIGGFFERTFAPRGLARIYDGILTKLDDSLR